MLFRRKDPIRRNPPAAQPSRPESIEIMLDGAPIEVQVRRHAQARRLTLRVRAAARDITLSAPPHVPLSSARDFVERHRDWIRTRLVRLPSVVPFVDGALVPVRGIPHRIVSTGAVRGTVAVAVRDEAPVLLVPGEAPHLARRVTDFLKREARRDLCAAVRRHAAALRVEIGRITLRDTASRWGSCSARGDLSFSWRLVMAPPMVLDYLAAHEVAHRLEMNHGPAYWRTVERVFPARREAEAWLKGRGADLHRYGG